MQCCSVGLTCCAVVFDNIDVVKLEMCSVIVLLFEQNGQDTALLWQNS